MTYASTVTLTVAEYCALKARIAELEKANEQLSGIGKRQYDRIAELETALDLERKWRAPQDVERIRELETTLREVLTFMDLNADALTQRVRQACRVLGEAKS